MQKPDPQTAQPPQPPSFLPKLPRQLPVARKPQLPFAAPHNPRRDQRILALAGLAALAVILVGIRFLIWPDEAARFFGLIGRPNGFQLHAAVALRDLWLGVLAIGLVWMRQWRALTLWLTLGALVSFGNAGIVVAEVFAAQVERLDEEGFRFRIGAQVAIDAADDGEQLGPDHGIVLELLAEFPFAEIEKLAGG